MLQTPFPLHYTLTSVISSCQTLQCALELHKKHPTERKAIQQKTFWTLYLLHRERVRLSGQPEKAVWRVNTQCLVIFLNDPYSNQQHYCVQMQSSALVCVLQIPWHCYITAYDEFLFKKALYYYLLCQQSQRLHLLQSCKKAGTACQILLSS